MGTLDLTGLDTQYTNIFLNLGSMNTTAYSGHDDTIGLDDMSMDSVRTFAVDSTNQKQDDLQTVKFT